MHRPQEQTQLPPLQPQERHLLPSAQAGPSSPPDSSSCGFGASYNPFSFESSVCCTGAEVSVGEIYGRVGGAGEGVREGATALVGGDESIFSCLLSNNPRKKASLLFSLLFLINNPPNRTTIIPTRITICVVVIPKFLFFDTIQLYTILITRWKSAKTRVL